MNGDVQLKLQAWVDGEISADEARQLEGLVATNPEAAALAGELRMTRGFLQGNELSRSVADTREFYWNQIRREIDRTEAPTPASSQGGFWAGLRRMLVPASGLALVVLVAGLSVKYFGPTSLEDAVQMIEVENLSEEMASISYRSHADKMFVVYVYSKDQASAGEDASSESLDDMLFQ